MEQDEHLLDEIVSFEDNDGDIIKCGKLDEVEVVLDYLWGEPALKFMRNLIRTRKGRTRALVQMGSISGTAEVAVQTSYLRNTNFSILGTVLGPLTNTEMSEIFKKCTIALADGVFSTKI